MTRTYTSTYAVLEVSEETFNGVKERLIEADSLDNYKDYDRQHGEILNFGTVALAVDKQPRLKPSRGECQGLDRLCNFHDTGGPKSRPCGILTYRIGLDAMRERES